MAPGRHGPRCDRGTGRYQGPATGHYQEQQLEQQQLPPPQVVDAPGATVTVSPPVAVLPTCPEKLNMTLTSLRQRRLDAAVRQNRVDGWRDVIKEIETRLGTARIAPDWNNA